MIRDERILEPGRIEAPLGEIRFLFLPVRGVFLARAERFRQLSHAHPLGGYLKFLALLSEAQEEAFTSLPSPTLPGPDERAVCRENGMPLLSARSWPRKGVWREGLTMILERVEQASPPRAAIETIIGLRRESEGALEEKADRILGGKLDSISPTELPFLAAALQAYWVKMASEQGEASFARLEQGGLCPVCGSYPNVALLGAEGAEKGLRYLSCSLCSSAWHMVRIKCSSCESTRGIDHFTLEGSNGKFKAESCEECGSYLKLLYLEKDCRMDAMADDLATLGLDMLMDREGKRRRGPNLFLHPGGV